MHVCAEYLLNLLTEAHCLELLRDHIPEGGKVLDVGCGSGILTALLGVLVGPQGKVISLDIYPELLEKAKGEKIFRNI